MFKVGDRVYNHSVLLDDDNSDERWKLPIGHYIIKSIVRHEIVTLVGVDRNHPMVWLAIETDPHVSTRRFKRNQRVVSNEPDLKS